MFRITPLTEDTHSISLKLEGWLVGQGDYELQRECERCLARKPTLVLDLSGIRFADRQGVNTLHSLLGPQMRLIGSSLFISGLLERVQGSPQ
jgi:anti-anti-sigma regulatory factor